MHETHYITEESEFIEVNLLVHPDAHLIKSIIAELFEQFPNEKRLWDLSSVVFDLGVSELEDIAKFSRNIVLRSNKTAVYATQDLAFGVMRQFSVFREVESQSEVKVFRDKDKAKAWLTA